MLLQTGMNRDANIPEVPTIYELMKQYQTPPRSQRLATVILAAGDIGRPIVSPPGGLRQIGSRFCATPSQRRSPIRSSKPKPRSKSLSGTLTRERNWKRSAEK